jgi:hypothetical protein
MSIKAVETLAREIFTSDALSARGRVNYLRLLVGATQEALGAPIRKHAGKGPKLSEADAKAALAAFEPVASSFYDAVMRAAADTLPKSAIRGATGFARSAASTLRGYIRSRADVRLLSTVTVTKAAIAVVAKPRKPNADALAKRIGTASKALSVQVAELVKLDAEAARNALGPVLAALGRASFGTVRPTKDAKVAVAEHRPWRVDGQIFMPLSARTELRDAA